MSFVLNTIWFGLVGVLLIGYAITTLATLLCLPHMGFPIKTKPFLFILPVLNLLAIANVPRGIHYGRDFRAFLSSCATIAALLVLFGMGVYPNLVISNPVPEHRLTIYNAASSPKTLKIMLAIALLGMPVVVAYTVAIYWIFRGKVKNRAAELLAGLRKAKRGALKRAPRCS